MFNFGKGKDFSELQKENEILEFENKHLREHRSKLKEEVEDLKLKKRIENEEITHLMKINVERADHKLEMKKIEVEREKQEVITKLKDDNRVKLEESLLQFHGKIEDRFNTELKNLKDIYNMLTAKLPDVNMTITKNISDCPTPIEHKE